MCIKSKPEAPETSQVAFMRNYLMKTVHEFPAPNEFATCPIGVLLLLTTLLGSGATRGKTGFQIAQSLQLKSPRTESGLSLVIGESKSLYRELVDELTSQETFIGQRRVSVISTSTAAFLQEGFGLEPNFVWSIQNEFRAHMKQLHFQNQSESARQINSWANSESRGLIPRIFQSPSELPRDTRVVMLNLFTFKDAWLRRFSAPRTKPEEFTVSSDTTKSVSMMMSVETLPYANFPEKGFAMIRKPLQNYRFSLVVLLPSEKLKLDGIEKVLTGEYAIKDLIISQEEIPISLKLPKFKLESTMSAIPILESMGVVDLFRRTQADLSGITEAERLYVSLLKQGVVLKVDENGVEAAAVTAAVAVPMSAIIPSADFHVNHPFVCMIYDEQLHIPLVVARVFSPEF
ncbi:unnamed protein product [Dicrocoelium dendriticum]|nr:unnamed protein product [Dicrocoelium dendriticum]